MKPHTPNSDIHEAMRRIRSRKLAEDLKGFFPDCGSRQLGSVIKAKPKPRNWPRILDRALWALIAIDAAIVAVLVWMR